MSQPPVVGAFHNFEDADRAIEVLNHVGFDARNIGFAKPGQGDDATSAAANGTIGGGIAGGVAGAVATGLIPGVGPLVSAGILAFTAGTALAGASVGGLLGTLIHLGLSDDDARFFADEFETSSAIVAVEAGNNASRAEALLRAERAYAIRKPGDDAVEQRPRL